MAEIRSVEPGPVSENTTVLLEWLRMTDARVQGVTRLDQQLVYVPLGAVAAAVYAVGAERGVYQSIGMSTWIIPMYGLVLFLVAFGLGRNHWRHWRLEQARHALLVRLGLEAARPRAKPSRRRSIRWLRRIVLWLSPMDFPFAFGRPVYFALFVVGFSFGSVALLRLLG